MPPSTCNYTPMIQTKQNIPPNPLLPSIESRGCAAQPVKPVPLHIARVASVSRGHRRIDWLLNEGMDEVLCEEAKTWVFPKKGVPQNGWFIMENLINMDDLRVPPFLKYLLNPPYKCRNGVLAGFGPIESNSVDGIGTPRVGSKTNAETFQSGCLPETLRKMAELTP